MKERFKHLIQDRIVKVSYISSLLLLLVAFIYTALLYGRLPPLIPIFNQLPWGMQRLADKIMIFLPIVVNSSILTVNIIFSQVVYKKMPLVVRMIGITTLFISFIVLVFLLRTTLLVL